jgi:hypothetical protein
MRQPCFDLKGATATEVPWRNRNEGREAAPAASPPAYQRAELSRPTHIHFCFAPPNAPRMVGFMEML